MGIDIGPPAIVIGGKSATIVKDNTDLVEEPVLLVTLTVPILLVVIVESIEHDANDTAKAAISVSVDHVHLQVHVLAVDGVLGRRVEMELRKHEVCSTTRLEELGETTSVATDLDCVLQDVDVSSATAVIVARGVKVQILVVGGPAQVDGRLLETSIAEVVRVVTIGSLKGAPVVAELLVVENTISSLGNSSNESGCEKRPLFARFG